MTAVFYRFGSRIMSVDLPDPRSPNPDTATAVIATISTDGVLHIHDIVTARRIEPDET